MIEKVSVRGIPVLARKNIASFADFLLNQGEVRTGRLVAINAEKVILAEEDASLKQLLRESEYCYADGISVVKAIQAKSPHHSNIERIAGADLWVKLMEDSGKLGVPVFLIGSQRETLEQTREKLAKWNVPIVGVQDGYFSKEEKEGLFQRISASGAKIVTVAMGSPKQEKLIVEAQAYYPQALYMGVGGSYDVFVGKVKRAPQIWQRLGLEWLYRLLSQPTRWRRQLRLMKFAYYYLTKQL
ncbi:lipopolysaccharide N-acetylmannosaminouronosyltransferase [Pasteurellaceae bacterium Macca]|nr:lipopolysaccharide N-acetylmannosaminouronosyltransferase [Pasteurellaceae bacterium Macca]